MTDDEFFKVLGIKGYKNILQFWSAMDEEYGLTRARQLESAYIKLEEGDDRTFYSMIYEEFDVGLAFASLRIDLYRSFVTWFKSQFNKEIDATIIDIGCGNGVLTCLLAANFPEARFIGFDISEAGIESADKLKQKLSLENVEFLTGDLKSLPKGLENIEADIAFSVASLDSGQQFEESAVNRSLSDLWQELEVSQKENGENLEDLVANLLKSDGGIFISFDKLVRPIQQMRRLQAMTAAGLRPDFAASAWLKYTDVQGEPVILPVISGRIKSGAAVEPPCNILDVIAFLIRKDRHFDEGSINLSYGQDALAEVAFTYLNPKTFIEGARADYRDGSGSIWQELWQAGPALILFEHSNHGYRGLELHPLTALDTIKNRHQRFIESSKDYAEVAVLEEAESRFTALKP